MIASSILNPVMFKNLSGNYANMWNTLHVNRKQGGARVIPYYQKFTKNHTLYLQFESDSDAAIILKSYAGTVEIETFTENYDSTAGISSVRYYTNFTVILDSPYFDKAIYFKATQGSDTLTSEPVWVSDLTDLIAKGVIKYIMYTNIDRIDADLPGVFVDWSVLPYYYFDFFIEAIDNEPNDTDENEVLEGSQSKTIISSAYFSGRTLKTGGLPDYMIARIGMASSLDVFTVNGLQYIKTGEIEQSQFGGSTLYQASMKLTQKTTIGINVDNIGSGSITPPPSGTLMYVGVVTEAVPTESQVKAITGITAVKTNQTKVYTMTNSRFCFAYPASYGSLTSIIDTIGDEIISGFAVQTLTFTTGGVTMNYNVYTLVSPATVTSFTVIFKF